jgi:hypothetical protein
MTCVILSAIAAYLSGYRPARPIRRRGSQLREAENLALFWMISGGEHGVCDMRHHVEFVVLAGRLFERDKKADEGNSAARRRFSAYGVTTHGSLARRRKAVNRSSKDHDLATHVADSGISTGPHWDPR